MDKYRRIATPDLRANAKLAQLRRRDPILLFFVQVDLILIFVLFACSCDRLNTNAQVQETHPVLTSEKALKDFVRTDADRVVYEVLLSRIHNNAVLEDKTILNGTKPVDLLVYQKVTIGPSSLEGLSADVDISPNFVNEFRLANAERSELSDHYDVLAPVSSYSNESDLDSFYLSAKQKFPEAKAVVAFSNVAYGGDHNEAVVYFEYFMPGRPKARVLAYLTLEKYQPNQIQDEIIGADIIKAFILH